jgi:hypothetical protein
VVKANFENTPNLGWSTKGVGPAGTTLARLGSGFVPHRPLVLDIMKICMDFGSYDAFPSSDVPEMVNQ